MKTRKNDKILNYRIDKTVLENIQKSLRIPETGGILGIDENGIVTKFYYDSTGITSKLRYIPDVKKLNTVIENWTTEGVSFVGFVHTHPKGAEKLSELDIEYAEKIKAQCSLSEILMLLYIPAEEKFLQYVI